MNSRAAGFSLVEATCALLILGLGLVGMVEAITVGLRASKESERGTVAPLLAAGRLETLRADGYLLAGEEEGEFGEDFPQYGWRETVTETSLQGLYEVAVAIVDRERKEDIYELRTYLFDQPLSSTYGTGAYQGASSSRRARGGER